MRFIGFLIAFFLGRDVMASLEVQIKFDKINSIGVGVNVFLFNNSNEKVCVNSSIIGLNGPFTEIVFDVKNGIEQVKFKGIRYVRLPEEHVDLTLLPGQKLTVSLDLSTDYDFSKPGNYSIRYETWNIAHCKGMDTGVELKSNVIYFKKPT